jgi:hypothetical protein
MTIMKFKFRPKLMHQIDCRKEKRKQRHKRATASHASTCDEEEDESSPTSQQPRYLTSRFRELTVKTPYFVDPSAEKVGVDFTNFT